MSDTRPYGAAMEYNGLLAKLAKHIRRLNRLYPGASHTVEAGWLDGMPPDNTLNAPGWFCDQHLAFTVREAVRGNLFGAANPAIPSLCEKVLRALTMTDPTPTLNFSLVDMTGGGIPAEDNESYRMLIDQAVSGGQGTAGYLNRMLQFAKFSSYLSHTGISAFSQTAGPNGSFQATATDRTTTMNVGLQLNDNLHETDYNGIPVRGIASVRMSSGSTGRSGVARCARVIASPAAVQRRNADALPDGRAASVRRVGADRQADLAMSPNGVSAGVRALPAVGVLGRDLDRDEFGDLAADLGTDLDAVAGADRVTPRDRSVLFLGRVVDQRLANLIKRRVELCLPREGELAA